jgi:hypothetical protein
VSGIVAGHRGRVAEGLEMMKAGIVNFRTLRGYQRSSAVLADGFDHWASVELAAGQPERAASIQAAAVKLRQGAPLLHHQKVAFDRRVARMGAQLNPIVFNEAWQQGDEFSIDDLIDFVTT